MCMVQNHFEVETRFWFTDKQEAMQALPFLTPCFTRSNTWHTVHYGAELYKRDVMLRINEACSDGATQMSLGWKSPDFGNFVNIREELEEDITGGIVNSTILAMFEANFRAESPADIVKELTKLGLPAFMEFSGANETGIYAPLELQLKWMHCSLLQYPWLLEIEKTAHNFEEAFFMEEELQRFSEKYQLTGREIEEPTTLLYQACFK